MSNITKDHHFFENWARKMNMRPVMKVEEKDGDILVADSGEPFFGVNADGTLGRWYRTGYAIQRGVAWIGNFAEYPAEEFGDVDKRKGQETRVNECLVAAREILKQTKDVGLYNGREANFDTRLN